VLYCCAKRRMLCNLTRDWISIGSLYWQYWLITQNLFRSNWISTVTRFLPWLTFVTRKLQIKYYYVAFLVVKILELPTDSSIYCILLLILKCKLGPLSVWYNILSILILRLDLRFHIDLNDAKATCCFFSHYNRYLLAVFDNMSCRKDSLPT